MGLWWYDCEGMTKPAIDAREAVCSIHQRDKRCFSCFAQTFMSSSKLNEQHNSDIFNKFRAHFQYIFRILSFGLPILNQSVTDNWCHQIVIIEVKRIFLANEVKLIKMSICSRDDSFYNFITVLKDPKQTMFTNT